MTLRNWLLAGTSMTLLALAPLGVVRAQDATDPALVAAFQSYQSDQSDTNKQKLTEACIGAGFQSLDDCISALTGAAPIDQASSEQAAPPSSEAAPAPQAEQPAPSSEATPAPSSEAAPQPSSEEVAPPPSSEAAPAPASEAAPQQQEAAPPASSEAAAPAASSEQPATPVSGRLGEQLKRAVDQYNAAVADLAAGKKNAQKQVDKAKASIDKLCSNAGFADTDSCLAQAGLSLSPLPGATEQPAPTSEEPTSALPDASEAVTPTAVEPLPADVSAEAAPILDSAKDDQASSTAPADQTSSASSEQPPAPEQPAGPPPTDDKQAQQDIQPPPPDTQSTVKEEGKRKGPDFQFIQPVVPTDNPDVKVVQQPKNDNGAFVFQIGINIYINNPRQDRDRFYDRDRGDEIYYEDLSRGRVREVITHRDGSQIVTIYARNGDVLQRSKILPNGREIMLATYDPRDRDEGQWDDPGRELPPLVLNIPARDYILDADVADEDQVQSFLDQPPVEQVRRIYTIDEVKRSARLRDSVRRLEVGNLTFDTGKATIAKTQVGALSKVAQAMVNLLKKNPGEVFLIEGHTDAVGSDVSNLVLSDERAATVARILTDFYDIPPENLVTQGYGERYLKVKTDGDEPLNRRVTVKRITPLVAYVGDNG
ncbi:MAG: OmpA family protein [Devosia sp.]